MVTGAGEVRVVGATEARPSRINHFFTVLGMFFVFLVFGSVHFYWGLQRTQFFFLIYHTKSRDDLRDG